MSNKIWRITTTIPGDDSPASVESFSTAAEARSGVTEILRTCPDLYVEIWREIEVTIHVRGGVAEAEPAHGVKVTIIDHDNFEV